MRIHVSQWDALTPEQRKLVTHIECEDEHQVYDVVGAAFVAKVGDAEEYPGEAAARGMDQRGFNR